MDAGAEQKIIGMLDVLANGLVEFRSEFDGFRAEFNDFRTEMYEFRAETSENFNRIERRLDNHEKRIEHVVQLEPRVERLEQASN